MHAFEIRPLVGIGPLVFGMGRDEARALLDRLGGGPCLLRTFTMPDTLPADTFFHSAFQVFYDETERVEFIECSREESFSATLEGKELLEMLADDAVDFLAGRAPGRWEEDGTTYLTPSLQVSLWRETTLERSFDTVGAGQAGYYK